MRNIWRLGAGLVLASAIVTGATAQPSGRLMVYTSQPSSQIAKVVEAFNKAHPKVQVVLYRSGTTEVMNRLQAEFTAGRPQADVVLVADAVATTQLKDDGRLLTYAKAPADKVPAALIDPDKTFFGTKLITTGIVTNTKLVNSAPTSWNDLLAPGVASKTIMAHPLYSGAAVIHVGTFAQQKDFGWPYFERLAQGGAIAAKGNGAVIEAVARGEKAYGVIIEYMAFNAQWKGSPVELRVPAGGRHRDHPAGRDPQDREERRGRACVRGLAVVGGGAAPVGEPGLFPDLRRRCAAQGLSAGVVAADHERRSPRHPGEGRGEQEAVHRPVRRLSRSIARERGVRHPPTLYGQDRVALGLSWDTGITRVRG